MVTIVKRVVGALLALVGLALTVVGVWFATQLGSSGTAEFTARPGHRPTPCSSAPTCSTGSTPTSSSPRPRPTGGSVWMALANPSDAAAVVGDAAARRGHRGVECATGRC